MENIPPVPQYDAVIFWLITNACNLSCKYCITENKPEIIRRLKVKGQIGQNPGTWIRSQLRNGVRWLGDKTSGQIKKVKQRGDTVVDLARFKNMLDRSDRRYLIRLTGGGEPALLPNFLELCRAITEKHVLQLTTNLTSRKIRNFADQVNPANVLRIRASWHPEELERRDLVKTYLANYRYCEEKGFRLEASIVAHPSFFSELPKYRIFLRQNGIEPTFTPYRGYFEDRFYPEAYTSQQLDWMDISPERRRAQLHSKGKVCPAGFSVGAVMSNRGQIHPCFALGQNMGNIYEGPKFLKSPIRCPSDYCDYPYYIHEPDLAEKARLTAGF